jgi:hypothetical protein
MGEGDFDSRTGMVVYDSLRQAYNVSRSLIEVDRRFAKLMEERGYTKKGYR